MAVRRAKWHQVFVNDKERRVFTGSDGAGGLCRNDEFKWRSVEGLAEEAGLTRAETEAIVQKYVRGGVIVPNDRGTLFGYWERVAPHLADPPARGPIAQDQAARIERAAKK